jgi:adenine specific DNA methylase Mod
MTKEQKFYKTLQDVFIGAKVEGKGGFVNLMKIKSNYYRKIEQLLKEDIEKALEKYPSFRDELFDKLYSFFSRYFTESGSIYFNSTPFHNNIYEKVYTDEKDVILFWKTQMLYYVKTDRIFRSLEFESDGFKFSFDASKIESKRANEKRSLIFELNKIHEDNTIVFDVQYSERGAKTKQDDILKAIKKQGIAITEEQLERAFRVFEKQSEVDFFINKNAKAFLQEQFKLWSYQYFWEGAKEWGADRVNQLQILKNIAFKIIDFISQFEDELVKIWNKPKFVKNSNYVITLDRILSACHSERSEESLKLVEKIKKHKNFSEQIKEWQELGIVDENFKLDDIFTIDLLSRHLSEKYQHLPIDTKYFKDLELEILSQFEDLDKALDGWLIKSENYQALNTILPKFKEKVQAIYIDPPFNTGEDFPYLDRFQDSSWLSLTEDRLRISRQLLDKMGTCYLHLDSNADFYGKILLDNIYGKDCFRVKVTWKRHTGPKVQSLHFPDISDFILVYSKVGDKWTYIPQYMRYNEDYIKKFYKYEDENGTYCLHNFYAPGDGPSRIFFGKEIVPPKGHHWSYTQENIDKLIKEGKIILDNKGFPKLKIYLKNAKGIQYSNIITDIHVIQGSSDEFWSFPTQKPEKLLSLFIQTTSNPNDLILDFFLGSGTTIAVAHKLGRKWLGVEMGEHFYSVVLPRMKKVLAYDKSGISKEVKEYQGGGFFKYYELEQYEEALANCKYDDSDLFNSPSENPYQEYVFMKDEKMLECMEIDYENNKVKVDLEKLYPNIDIAETLSNLTGKWIKKITPLTPLQEGNYEVEFEDETKIDTKVLDYKLIKPLIWWE